MLVELRGRGWRLLPRNSNTPNSVCEINNGMCTLKFQSVCEIDVLQMDTHRYLNEFMHLSVSKVSQ